MLCWSQLRGLCCVGHSSEAYAVLVTAQRLMLCWSQLGGLCCVGHSSEAYAVLVVAPRLFAVLVTARRYI